MTELRSDSMRGEDAPANSSGVWRRSCDVFSTLLTAIPTRESVISASAAANDPAWLNSM